MKAAYIDEPGKIAVRETAMPVITDDEDVIIEVRFTGICGSDVHAFKGENPFMVYPRIFGHEFSGQVYAVGSAVTGLKLGDHVVAEPIEYCGTCYACRNGHPNVCEHLQVFGVHVDGGCREYVKVKQQHALKIQESVPWEYATLAEPLSIGFRCCTRGQIQKDDCVLVMGAGTIGLSVLMAAKSKGARVIITDLFDDKLDYARTLGADYTINAAKQDVNEEVLRITQGNDANVVIDGVGTKASLEQAITLASVAGRIVELDMTDKVSEISHKKLCQRDLTLCGTRLQAHEFPEAIAYVEQNWTRLKDFITGIYPIEEVGVAFEWMIANPAQTRKLLIKF